MKSSAVHRVRPLPPSRNGESGLTIMLVAAAMVAIMGMAALSIDVLTLYLARAEAQRAADAAALAAARVISISGITGNVDPTKDVSSWQSICGSSGLATLAAQAVAGQNPVGGASATAQVHYTYSKNSGSPALDCSALGAAFAVNPQVTVQVQRTNLPTFFARIWQRTGSSVSASATAEAFNPSDSGDYAPGGTVPVQPRCVKPWIVPNVDPGNPLGFVHTNDGSIRKRGISLSGGSTPGVIGERFFLVADCGSTTPCSPAPNPPQAIPPGGGPGILQYLPGQVLQASTAVPSKPDDSCSLVTSDYAQAIAGCDQTTAYQCGVANKNEVDLKESPGGASGDTINGVQCRIRQTTPGSVSGQDTLDDSSFPFQITAGTQNPLGLSGNLITSSTSLVSLPIYDTVAVNPTGTTDVTIVGFLEVFINGVQANGDVDVTVVNVAGCSNNAPNPPVTGTSPIPVRLITPPTPGP